jgi:hypothetical protein
MRDASADHDVFISYAHIDNQTLSAGQELQCCHLAM